MSRLIEMGLAELVEPLPHPDRKRSSLFSAYWAGIDHLDNQQSRNPDDLSIKADYYSLERMLGRFWGEGRMSIHHALNDSDKIQKGELWIPVAPGTKLGAPVAPIQRAYEREAATILSKESPDKREIARALELKWLADVFRVYSTQPILAEGDPTRRWMTEEVAHELYVHAKGKDALDDWNRAKILMSEPILLVP